MIHIIYFQNHPTNGHVLIQVNKIKMDYKPEELQRHRKSHKRRFIVVLNEMLESLRTPSLKVETIAVRHECIEFLQHIDFRRHLKELYPDLVASIGHKYGQIELKGPVSQVVDAKVIINERVRKICTKQLTQTQSDLVWHIVAKNQWDQFFSGQLGKENIKAKVCTSPSNTVVILANSQEECERAFHILFEIIREDKLSITKDCSIRSDQFQSLISRLQRGSLVQIEVLQDDKEELVRIIGIEAEIVRATKEISNFVNKDGIRSEAYRPQVSKYIWGFLSRRVHHDYVKQIVEDLEQYSVSIQITDDHEHFLIRGFSEGIEQSKQRISELASMIVEQEKKLEYPGIKQLFLDQSGKEQLIMIEKEKDVKIEIAHSGRRYSKIPVPVPRTFSLPTKKNETAIYDVCNFTTKEGVYVSWKYGSIENEVADVLVNSAHSNLNDLTACGQALVNRGGSSFQEACKPHTAVKAGDIVATESGNLSSKHVIHAVCCNWLQFNEDSLAREFLRGLVRKILEKCDELKTKSLAIPMIGAGQHGFPEDVVVQVIKEAVSERSSIKGVHFTLEEVCLIVFDSKSQRRKSVPLPKKRGVSRPSMSKTKEQTSSPEIVYGSVRIRLLSGSVAEFKSDAFMNLCSTNPKVTTITSQYQSLGQNSTELVDSAPEELMKPPPHTVLMTKASPNANVMYHMHCVPVSFDMSGLENAANACLNAAQFFPLDSVIISASGITSLGVPANECAEAILNASKMFSNENFSIDIAVVVFDDDMIQIFENAFEEKIKEQTTSVKTKQAARSHDATMKHQSGMNTTLNIGVKEEIVFRVVGFYDNVSMSIEKIEEYFNRFKVTKSVKEVKIVKGLWEHTSQIRKLSKGYDVLITLTDDELSIEGMGQQVFECKDELIEFLMKHDEKLNELKRLRKISKSVQWSYSDVNATVFIDDILNGMIESEFRAGNKNLTLDGIDNTYDLDLDKMVIQESLTGLTALLSKKHMEKNSALGLPRFWEPHVSDEVRTVALPSSSIEYQKVVNLLGSINDVVIVEKIERIQNPRLYKMYVCKRESMGSEANEKQLFHGTKAGNISSINTNNFNRRFSGINGTKFGDGVYFSRNSKYSARFSLLKDTDSQKLGDILYMYVAKVLVGMSVKGDPKMRVLPKRDDPRNPELVYDTAVNDTKDPSIFVTFDDHQCYPEYLITFKSR